MNNKMIFAILDTVANDILGGVHIHRHEAAAIRFFTDVATMPDSIVGKHPRDFHLIQLGYLADDHTLIPGNKTIITGAAWLQMQELQQEALTNAQK